LHTLENKLVAAQTSRTSDEFFEFESSVVKELEHLLWLGYLKWIPSNPIDDIPPG
jgi:hypothetical protein